MKNKNSWRLISLVFALNLTLTSCASFEPTRMPRWELQDYPYKTQQSRIDFAARSFTREEIKMYFASDLAKKNIWPVHATLVNNSSQTYLFSKGMIEPSTATSNTASRLGRRSAGHRLFWGSLLIASFFGIPLGIPLVITGFQALGANSYMETEYKRLEMPDGQIRPGEKLSGTLFFHQPEIPSTIKITLTDTKTDTPTQILLELSRQPQKLSPAKPMTGEEPKLPIEMPEPAPIPDPKETSIMEKTLMKEVKGKAAIPS